VSSRSGRGSEKKNSLPLLRIESLVKNKKYEAPYYVDLSDSPLDARILLSTLFSDTLNERSSFGVRGEISLFW
jgi:hypothetical protein